ncbi:hypothetical protein [Prosthecochloris aestuarii]|uniref:hypothetical protein n=1 Tax=Prosthecochloris aestuarii TaxID=1102 RepID=UPI0012324467|nr:hypothetical protein [Prosthecochloris aestuarii]
MTRWTDKSDSVFHHPFAGHPSRPDIEAPIRIAKDLIEHIEPLSDIGHEHLYIGAMAFIQRKTNTDTA